jgi:hypothetical protein
MSSNSIDSNSIDSNSIVSKRIDRNLNISFLTPL